MTKQKKIAIVGSGISGLSTAWALRHVADVTLFEAQSRIGGHAYTVDAVSASGPFSVDVGFIVCNPLNYQNFMQFMDCIGVETIPSDMSFAVSDPQGFEWSSNPAGLFAQKRNLFRPKFWSLLSEILRFNKQAQEDASASTISRDLTLGGYLDKLGFSQSFREQYIFPMGAAIWSTPEAEMADYPASSFLDFFNNHRLLHRERPQWRTVKGGSRSYVERLVEALGSRIKTDSEVTQIVRTSDGVDVYVNGTPEHFEEVVLAGSAPLSCSLLGDGFEHQKSVLAPMKTVPNRAVLHSDPALMPIRKSAWASWNVMKGKGRKVSLSYWMNKLQDLATNDPVFVTLNPEIAPDPSLVHGEYDFEHPLFNRAAQSCVDDIKRINGRDGLWFAGAWLGHGFHEDGLKSGVRVAQSLGAVIPWTTVDADPYLSETDATRTISEPRQVVNA